VALPSPSPSLSGAAGLAFGPQPLTEPDGVAVEGAADELSRLSCCRSRPGVPPSGTFWNRTFGPIVRSRALRNAQHFSIGQVRIVMSILPAFIPSSAARSLFAFSIVEVKNDGPIVAIGSLSGANVPDTSVQTAAEPNATIKFHGGPTSLLASRLACATRTASNHDIWS
jgi:hypothetical protein